MVLPVIVTSLFVFVHRNDIYSELLAFIEAFFLKA